MTTQDSRPLQRRRREPTPPPRLSSHRASEKKKPRFSFAQLLSELMIIIGLLGVSFAYYEAFYTNVASGRMQDEASSAMERAWENEYRNPREKHTPALGEAFARMYIPSFGSDFHFAIVEGTTDADLEIGPGRYVDTQMPGEQGNFSVAGHRVGKGAPFNDLENLNTCDSIIIETSTAWNVYKVLPIDAGDGQSRMAAASACFTPEQSQKIAFGKYAGVNGRHITLPSDVSVIDPIPGAQEPIGPDTERLITLTTCHPQFSNAERMIVHGMLVQSMSKAQGTPAELTSEV